MPRQRPLTISRAVFLLAPVIRTMARIPLPFDHHPEDLGAAFGGELVHGYTIRARAGQDKHMGQINGVVNVDIDREVSVVRQGRGGIWGGGDYGSAGEDTR